MPFPLVALEMALLAVAVSLRHLGHASAPIVDDVGLVPDLVVDLGPVALRDLGDVVLPRRHVRHAAGTVSVRARSHRVLRVELGRLTEDEHGSDAIVACRLDGAVRGQPVEVARHVSICRQLVPVSHSRAAPVLTPGTDPSFIAKSCIPKKSDLIFLAWAGDATVSTATARARASPGISARRVNRLVLLEVMRIPHSWWMAWHSVPCVREEANSGVGARLRAGRPRGSSAVARPFFGQVRQRHAHDAADADARWSRVTCRRGPRRWSGRW